MIGEEQLQLQKDFENHFSVSAVPRLNDEPIIECNVWHQASGRYAGEFIADSSGNSEFIVMDKLIPNGKPMEVHSMGGLMRLCLQEWNVAGYEDLMRICRNPTQY